MDFQKSEINEHLTGLRRSMPCELCKKRFRTMIRILSVYYSDISAYSRAKLKNKMAVPMFLFGRSRCRQNAKYFSGFSRKTIKTESPVCADRSVSRRRYDMPRATPSSFCILYQNINAEVKQPKKSPKKLTSIG